VACHLVGNAGLSKHVHELSLELDYVCIFLASVRCLGKDGMKERGRGWMDG